MRLCGGAPIVGGVTRTRAVDAVLAAALAALGFCEATLGLTMAEEPVALAATAVLVAAPLAFRRDHPLPVLAAVCGGLLLQAALGSGLPGGLAGFVALGLAIYTAAAATALRTAVAALVGSVLAACAVVALSGDSRAGNYVYVVCVALAAWLGGRAVRLAGERSALLSERRATQERSRIARELHDVVSHHVTAIVVRAAAERRSMGDVPAAQVLAEVEQEGRETLHELRRLLGVLRVDDPSGVPTAPQPGLSDLPGLVRASGAKGVPATLRVHGPEQRLGEGLALVVYRVVQESLTNAAKHLASAHAEISLRWSADRLSVEVLSRGTPTSRTDGVPGGGFGLTGMSERVHAYGGALDAGATDGGFRVHASFPLDRP